MELNLKIQKKIENHNLPLVSLFIKKSIGDLTPLDIILMMVHWN